MRTEITIFSLFLFSFLYTSISCQTSNSNLTPVQYRLRQIMLEPKISGERDKKIYAKAEECLKRAKKGEDFTKLAKALSEEPNSHKTGGDLGYFTFDGMVEPFSKAVFSMKKGEIAGPVKTQYGYHIIKLYDIKGDKRHAAHILFALTPGKEDTLEVTKKLETIRNRIIKGDDFGKILKEYNTYDILAETNGYMVWQKPEDMLDSFRDAIKGLKKGDLSQPFQSILGFHILLVDSINYDQNLTFSGLPSSIGKK